jgi:N-acetylated-alpha-linked acidic dipeptidase
LQESSKVVEDGCLGCPVSFTPLHKSIKQLEKAATKILTEKKVTPISSTENIFLAGIPLKT